MVLFGDLAVFDSRLILQVIIRKQLHVDRAVRIVHLILRHLVVGDLGRDDGEEDVCRLAAEQGTDKGVLPRKRLADRTQGEGADTLACRIGDRQGVGVFEDKARRTVKQIVAVAWAHPVRGEDILDAKQGVGRGGAALVLRPVRARLNTQAAQKGKGLFVEGGGGARNTAVAKLKRVVRYAAVDCLHAVKVTVLLVDKVHKWLVFFVMLTVFFPFACPYVVVQGGKLQVAVVKDLAKHRAG